jgi:hypothetical protein
MGHYSWNIGLLGYGNLWKSSRRLLHEFFSARGVTKFDDYQRKHAYHLLSQLAESPENFSDRIELWVLIISLNSHPL